MVTKSGYCVQASLCMATKQAFYTATTLIKKIWQPNWCKLTSGGTLMCLLNCQLDMHYTRVVLNHTNHPYFPKQHNGYVSWICSLVRCPKPLIGHDTEIVLGLAGQQSLYQCCQPKTTPTKTLHIIHVLNSAGLPYRYLSYCYTNVCWLCLVQQFLETCYIFFVNFNLF